MLMWLLIGCHIGENPSVFSTDRSRFEPNTSKVRIKRSDAKVTASRSLSLQQANLWKLCIMKISQVKYSFKFYQEIIQ